MTATLLQDLVANKALELSETAQAVMPHLIHCLECRIALKQALESANAPLDHPAARILKDADEWVRWQEAAETATKAAQQALLDQGIGYVYGRDGVVYRRMPDGHEERVVSSAAQVS